MQDIRAVSVLCADFALSFVLSYLLFPYSLPTNDISLIPLKIAHNLLSAFLDIVVINDSANSFPFPFVSLWNFCSIIVSNFGDTCSKSLDENHPGPSV